MAMRGAQRLFGRRRECAALDQILADVRTGHSRALVIRGDAGVGKSVLLDYLAEQANGCRISGHPVPRGADDAGRTAVPAPAATARSAGMTEHSPASTYVGISPAERHVEITPS
jgi:hypothetical protein